MNKRHYEHTLPNIRGSLSNTYEQTAKSYSNMLLFNSFNLITFFFGSTLQK